MANDENTPNLYQLQGGQRVLLDDEHRRPPTFHVPGRTADAQLFGR